jgi:hypothetical protein
VISVRMAGIVLGGLLAGWLVSEVAQLIPGIRRTPVIGSTLAQSPSTTPAVTYSNRTDTRPVPPLIVSPASNGVTTRRVRPVTGVATARPAMSVSSIEPHEEAANTPNSIDAAARMSRDGADPHAVIDWLLDHRSRGE